MSTEGQADLLKDARLMAITCALGIKTANASKHHDNLINSNRKALESMLTILTEFYISTEDCLKLTKWPVFRVTRPYSNLLVKPRNTITVLFETNSVPNGQMPY